MLLDITICYSLFNVTRMFARYYTSINRSAGYERPHVWRQKMTNLKQTVRTAACSAFIFALAVSANAQSTMKVTATASNENAVVLDDDDPAANKKGKGVPGRKNEAQVNVTAAYEVDGTKANDKAMLVGKKISTSKENESVIAAFNKAQLTLKKVIMEKSGDVSNEDASAFYGVNAGLVATNGSSVTADECSVTTDAEGANGVFATGTNTKIVLHNIQVRTSQNGSRGLDATYGGSVTACDAAIETKGAHCAALATDRGGGTVTVTRGTATVHGEGSHVLYLRGNITANDMKGFSEVSEIGVIEGKNSLAINGGSYTNNGTNAFMLYQSTSGDAEEGTASFSAKKATFNSQGNGAFFYITNTDAQAQLTDCTINAKDEALVNAAGNNSERGWGRKGSNGATFRLSLNDMHANGDVNCDGISTVAFSLGEKVSYKGSVDHEASGAVSVSMVSSAKWDVTADSYVASFKDDNVKLSNIKSNGHTVYYDQTAKDNKYLQGKTYKLAGGGKLTPYTPDRKAPAVGNDTAKNGGRDGMNGGMGGAPDMNGGPNGMNGGMQNGDRPQPPKLESLTGIVKVTGKGSKQAVDLTTKDGKHYLLTVMDMKKNGAPGDNMAPGGNKPADGGMAPAGNNAPDNNAAPADSKNGDRKPPKMVTMDDLLKLDGKQVTLRGLFADKDKTLFTVFEY